MYHTWILLCLIISIRIFLGSPVFFKQARPGLNENIFDLFKFRSMLDVKDKSGNLLPDANRITKFGKFLRSSSLDELPSLWNVLKGDISLIGPRPLLVDYLPHYSEQQRKRHQVKPGVTGWAQVNGRNAISWEEKFNYDIWYVENQNIWLDIKILFLTVKKVIKRDGISPTDVEFMPRFDQPDE